MEGPLNILHLENWALSIYHFFKLAYNGFLFYYYYFFDVAVSSSREDWF